MAHSPEQYAAWKDMLDAIRATSSDIGIVPDTDPPKLQVQVNDPMTSRQAMLNFVQPPEVIIHFDDQNVSASGGTSAFGIEMAKLADGKFELMRRNKQLTPQELGNALGHWLQSGTLF